MKLCTDGNLHCHIDLYDLAEHLNIPLRLYNNIYWRQKLVIEPGFPPPHPLEVTGFQTASL